jgi:hypothetical protein
VAERRISRGTEVAADIFVMDTIALLNLRQWVSNYCRKFHSANEADQRNIILKEAHTYGVAANMLSLSGALLRNRNRVMMAETIGLLHDIGRFPQYAHYKTFRDSISVNHGRLGAEVIRDERVLGDLPVREQEIIMDAVRFHNAPSVPGALDPETAFFLRLIRDADKLDIWRVFADYYDKDNAERESAAGLGLPDTPAHTDAVVSCLAEKRLATLSALKTLNDFRVLQLTWAYDLNFPASFRLALEQGHIERIIATLPETDHLAGAVSVLRKHMREKAEV